MTNIQLLLVVESNVIVKSDDAYFAYLMKNLYKAYLESKGKNGVHLDYKFIHMDGKGNYKSKDVTNDIRDYINEYIIGDTKVIYCFDIDNKNKDNTKFLEKAKKYCYSKGYEVVVSYKEIEDVLNVKEGNSKRERVKYFAKHYPSISQFNISSFKVEYDKVFNLVGQTNFGNVIDNLLNKIINNK